MNLISVNSLEAQFYCFISFHLWLGVYCQALCGKQDFYFHFTSVDPKEIVSINEKISIYFQAEVASIKDLNVTFNDSLGATIFCLNKVYTTIDPMNSMVSCTTGTFDNFIFGSPLDLVTIIYCGNTVDLQITANVSKVIDPEIEDYTKYVFMGEQSNVILNYANIHEKHINSTSLSYKETYANIYKCDRVSFKNKAHRFKCLVPQFNQTQGLVNGTIVDFVVSLTGRDWKTLKLSVLPMPTIEGTLGSTFAGALNPISIIGSGFSPLFASQLLLVTSKSKTPNKCSYFNETHLRCIAAHGLTPVNLATQFTAIEIFDATRKEVTPCTKVRFTSVSTLTCEPVVYLSPDDPYHNHVTLKISSWQITHCINCPTSASSYSKTFIVVGILSAFLLSIATAIIVCNQLETSNSLGVFKPRKPLGKALGRPLAKPVVEPVVKSEVESLSNSEIVPLIKSTVEPLAKSEVEPLAKPLAKPVVESVVKSEIEPLSKSEVEPLDKSEVDAVKTLVKPLVKTHNKRQVSFLISHKDNHRPD
uniref:Uncharacterized protein n=1 Tax=Tetranychus urticae TaxID=32264 RepID=T1KDT9_TETUR